MKAFFFACILVVALSASVFAAETVYVQSVKAKVMAEPSLKAEVVGEVAKGHRFDGAVKEGGWVKVKMGTREGFVSALLVGPKPPLDKQGLIGEESEIREGARRRASTFASAAAARGLTADDRRRLGKEEKVNYEALDKVEAFSLTEKEITAFAEGK